jgi:hypothetical protein
MWDDNVCIMGFIFLCLYFKFRIVVYWLFAFISVIPESFERTNTPADDG